MYKIFMNGSLYKVTRSMRCVENIVERFSNNWIKNTEIIVENENGEIIYEIRHF